MMFKYIKYTVLILFSFAFLFGLLENDTNQYTVNNQSSEVKLSTEAQSELWDFYQKAQNLSNPQNSADSKIFAAFLAVGDIMLSRNVAQKIKKTNDLLLPFSRMTQIFQSVDFALGNLESPLIPIQHLKQLPPVPGTALNGKSSMIFGTYVEYLKGLTDSRFKVLNLSNNHILDQGLDGLIFTRGFLEYQEGIKTIGAGMSLNEAWTPAVIEQNSIRICFVGASYASINDNGKTTNDYVARIEDLKNLKSSILNLKSDCDFLIASMHAGTEYTRKPNQAQINFAHAAIDYGADMVIGHHPHWIQEIERYCPNSATELDSPSPSEGRRWGERLCDNPKYIFYSLGNFIFDQMWSEETREGLALKIQISKIKNQNVLQGPREEAQLDFVELMPVIIDDYSTPRPTNEEETKKILQKIGETETIVK